MFLGYNTNGFAHHRLEDAVDILADLGYKGLGLTADFHTIDPMARNWRDRAVRLRKHLREVRLRAVVETGARFVLDPRRKHQPTLLDPDRHKALERLHYVEACIELAVEIDESVVSFWSGAAPPDMQPKILMARLVEACQRLCHFAGDRRVRLAFEPEPGMFIDTMDKFAELCEKVNHPSFGLTLDVGHLVCMGDVPASAHIKKWQDKLFNVHIEDMKKGVHEHLMFGEGEVDFADVFGALKDVGYSRGVYVELSRHSHDAVEAAKQALAFLTPFVAPKETPPLATAAAEPAPPEKPVKWPDELVLEIPEPLPPAPAPEGGGGPQGPGDRM